jgi:hypothetical protein
MPEQTIEDSDASRLKQKCSYISHTFICLFLASIFCCCFSLSKKKRRDNKILMQEMSTLPTARWQLQMLTFFRISWTSLISVFSILHIKSTFLYLSLSLSLSISLSLSLLLSFVEFLRDRKLISQRINLFTYIQVSLPGTLLCTEGSQVRTGWRFHPGSLNL